MNLGYVGETAGLRTYAEAVGPQGPDMSGAGWPSITSEHLMAYELGYRAEIDPKFAYDFALFFYKYDNLRMSKQGAPFKDQYNNMIIPFVFVDDADGRNDAYALGGEVAAHWNVSEAWRLSGSYGRLESTYNEGKSPPNQVKCISSWDLGSHWQFDATLRYVDYLASMEVPSYLTMDCRLAWQPRKNVEFAVIGRNLLQEHHWEFGPTNYPYYVTEVSRSVFGKVTWTY
jgi:iron complex outermembrane receptor protein